MHLKKHRKRTTTNNNTTNNNTTNNNGTIGTIVNDIRGIIRKDDIDIINIENNGRVYAREFRQKVLVDKKIKKGNKVLIKSKENEVALTNVIKTMGDGENAVCPRCGHTGTIASYIDGCDYCHSKFKVSDFEEKVSGFSVEEDGNRGITRLCKNIFKTYAITVALTYIIAILLMIFLMLTQVMEDGSGNFFGKISLLVMMIVAVLMVISEFAITIGIIIGIITFIVVVKNRYERIEKNDVLSFIEENIDGFSGNDFVQNLEYKLRNMHFAENADEIRPYTSFSVEEIISKYENVIECFLHKVKFISFKPFRDNYIIDIEVDMKLTRLKGNKVKKENEKLYMTLTRKKDISEYNIGNILEFTCSNCGCGIDMFKGGICDYCGEKIEYSDYDWIIDKYYSNINVKEIFDIKEKVSFGNKKYVKPYKKVKKYTIGVIILGLVLIFSSIGIQNCNEIYLTLNMSDVKEKSANVYEEIPKPEDVYLSNLVKISEYEDGFEKYIYYELTCDFDYVAREYSEMMTDDNGYEILKYNYDTLVLGKKYDYKKISSWYAVITLVQQGDELQFKYEIFESKEEYENY